MTKAALTYENFFEHLLSEVPDFLPVYKEHLKDNDELLHHVLMGDLTRYCIALYREGYPVGNRQKQEALGKILQILDRGMKSFDEKLQELISVSFLENIRQPNDDQEHLRNMLPPALLTELHKQESWRPN